MRLTNQISRLIPFKLEDRIENKIGKLTHHFSALKQEIYAESKCNFPVIRNFTLKSYSILKCVYYLLLIHICSVQLETN